VIQSTNTDFKKRRWNIRLLYGYAFFWMFLIIMPVITPYYLHFGFSMQQIFLLQVAFGTCTLILEVPSGYLADLWGRKNTLILGALLYAVGYGAFLFAESFQQFFMVQLILGAAMSLASGTDLALLYAWINTQTTTERAASARMLAHRQMAQVGSESIAALLGGTLVFWSFQHVLKAQALVAILPLGVALLLSEAPYVKMTAQHKDNLKQVYTHIFKTDGFLKLLFLNQMVWSLSTFLAVWTFQKYWQDLSIPLRWFGVLWAAFNLTVGVTGQQVQHWEKRWGSHVLLHALALLSILGFWGMALALSLFKQQILPPTAIWGMALAAGLCFQVSRGITGVLMREAFNWRLPDSFRATANSLSSMAFRLGFAILGPIMGWMIDAWSLSIALAVMGGVFCIAYFLLLPPLIKGVPAQLES
jgi:MFS family permease